MLLAYLFKYKILSKWTKAKVISYLSTMLFTADADVNYSLSDAQIVDLEARI